MTDWPTDIDRVAGYANDMHVRFTAEGPSALIPPAINTALAAQRLLNHDLREVVPSDYPEDDLLAGGADAVEELHWAWEQFSDANTPTELARATLRLQDAVSDVTTFHPRYDSRIGGLPDPNKDDGFTEHDSFPEPHTFVVPLDKGSILYRMGRCESCGVHYSLHNVAVNGDPFGGT